ncbi:Uncharacterised protein [uncultured Clostridium sp.]|uniref:glycosyltransferase family 4 protein n=1 Tax=uncultured Clostridium sp. TaxID=59620 RepID=UPI0008207F4E|nr:glycosyltransferase family 4 protein [uncultured Clostridium sp.]SCJ41866.1 Uncharacterised protein [uncultured Clostridium sp.]
MSKKVLFIAYHFPPIGGSGVQRSLKYVKYLPMYEYKPLVCTVKNGHNFAYDYTLLDEIPNEAKVYRSNSGETLLLREIIEKTSAVLRKLKRSKKNNESNTDIKKIGVSQDTIKDKIFRYLEYNYFIPDTKIRWYKHAINDIKKRILVENDIDIIYSTSSPYTDHLIALEIKKYTNKPWIADFRDPWVGNVFIANNYSKKRLKMEAQMERAVIENADKIIMVTDTITENYKKSYPEYADKFITITNGFDSSDKVDIAVDNEKFIINYSGILTEGQSPDTLIRALEKLCCEDEKFRKNLKVNFTGLVIPQYEFMIRNSKINENIIINSYMTHEEVVKQMSKASINFVILADRSESRGVFTGKIFDYILAERPVLGIMPSNGVASNLINNRELGLSIDHGEVDKVCEFIKLIYNKWLSNEEVRIASIERCQDFDRRYLTKQLSSIMDKLI